MRQDQVEAVVDDGFLARPARIVPQHVGNAVVAVLRAERQDGGGATEGRRYRARVEIVGAHHAHARQLLDVGVAVDAARQHPQPPGVDVFPARRQVLADPGDDAIAHADIGMEGAVGVGDPAIADDQVERLRGVCRMLHGEARDVRVEGNSVPATPLVTIDSLTPTLNTVLRVFRVSRHCGMGRPLFSRAKWRLHAHLHRRTRHRC